MRVAELLAQMAKAPGAQGGGLRIVDGDGLEYIGPRGILTDEIRAFVREHRSEIVAWLRSPVSHEDGLLFDYKQPSEPLGAALPFPAPTPSDATEGHRGRDAVADRQQALFPEGVPDRGGASHE